MMAQKVGEIYYDVDADTTGLRASERKVHKSTGKMGKNFDAMGNKVQRAGKSLFSFSNIAQSVATVLVARQVIQYADAYTQVQNKLKVVTENTQELADVQAKLLDLSNRTRSDLDSTVTLYSKMTRATEALGIGQERMLSVIETVNKSFALSGASAQEASNAIRQLSQGLAAGALRGDEFNSVAEQAPEILRAVAQETGKTIGELREFAAEGGITSELLISALENYKEEVDEAYDATERTFGQGLTQAKNNAITFIGEIETGSGVIGLAGDAVVKLSENIDKVAKLALIAGTIFAGKFVFGQAAAAAAMVRTAGAAGALRGALSLLGGPVGLIVTTLSALALYQDGLTETERLTKSLKEETDKLTSSYDKLNESQIRIEQQNLINERNKLTQELAKEREELERLDEARKKAANGLAGGASQLAAFSKQAGVVAKKEEELNAVVERQAELFNQGLPEQWEELGDNTDDAGDAAEKATKSFNSLNDSLQQQIIALETSKQASEIYAAIQKLGADATEEQISAIVNQINKLYELKAANEAASGGDSGMSSFDRLKQEIVLQQQRNQLTSDEFELKRNLAALDENDEGYEQQVEEITRLTEKMQALRFESELIGESLQKSFQDVGLSAMDQFSSGLANLIVEGGSAKDMIQGLASTIATELLTSIIRYYVGQAAAAMLGIGQTTSAGIAQAAALASAYAPAAVAANIATSGGAALAAAASAPIAATATTGAIAGASLGGGFLYGGTTQAGRMHPVMEDGRPELLQDGTRSYLMTPKSMNVVSNKDMTGGGGGANIQVNVKNYSGQSVDVQRGKSQGGMSQQEVINIVVGDVRRRGKVHSAITDTTSANNKVRGG